MYPILDSIQSPADLRRLDFKQLDVLADEIRRFLIDAVSKTGGHLASNLGVVDLTIALHKVYNTPHDKIIWDVGHQAYVHKILTGRKDKFDTLRQEGGLSGFPKTSESVYDCFNTGHSSTSISAALGFARARDLLGQKHRVIAVIGDGALTGGLAYEALNDAGNAQNDLIVVLNDNEMSIAKNVGGMSEYLSRLRTRPSYFKMKLVTEKTLSKAPHGDILIKIIRRLKTSLRHIFIPYTIFEELGFTYLGPVDGHDIKKTAKMLERAKTVSGPVLIHVYTRKGKGYAPAEDKPQRFHGISRFDVESGEVICTDAKSDDYSSVFGRHLVGLAEHNPRIVAISPAMPLGSGLLEFARRFPDRFFDVGIAESHAVTLAAGLTINGFVPVVAIYSSFLQRAYDQVLHDVAMQNLHVVLCVDRAGVVGDDGETHQGVFDIAFLNHIPNMALLAPSSFAEFEQMLSYAILEHNGPIAIRYPKGCEQFTQPQDAFEFGRGAVIKEGSDVSIIALGNMLKNAYGAAGILDYHGISAEVVSLRSAKPLDEDLVLSTAKKTGRVLVVEDGALIGGVGSMIASLFQKHGIDAVFDIRGYPDKFISQAKQDKIHRRYGLDESSLAKWALKKCRPKRPAVLVK